MGVGGGVGIGIGVLGGIGIEVLVGIGQLGLVLRSRWGSGRGCSVEEFVFVLRVGVSRKAASARRRRVLYW